MRPLTASKATSTSSRRVSTRPIILAAAGLMLALGIAMPTASAVPASSLASKQAQASELDRQVSRLEDRYGSLQEKWRGALVELREIRADVKRTRVRLGEARADLRGAKGRLQERAIAIYRDGGGSTELQQVAEAGSIEDFFDRVETIDRVSDQDASILERVRTAAQRVQREERRLAAASVQQAKVVRRAERSKRKMKKVLVEKQAALASVTADIRAIMEAQRAAAAAADAARARSSAARFSAGGGAGAAVAGSVSSGGDAASGGGGSTSGGGGSSSGGGSVAVPLPPASGAASAAASIAVGKSGAPYVYGAAGPDSFDCSGLVVWAFAQAGRPGLPHSTYSLIGMGVEVPLAEAQVGDLVFTNSSGHMGIYVGGGSFVHSPRTGRTVTVESLAYYSVVSVRRI